ncbi:MAG: hypothetical protein ABII68_02200 [Pseudomonadota bacterium]
MDFERYYIDLFEMLNSACKKIASGNYDKKDAEKLFGLSQTGRYPGLFSELAESFGMMMVKVEAREFRLKQIIEELEETKAKLEKYSQTLEQRIGKRNGDKL